MTSIPSLLERLVLASSSSPSWLSSPRPTPPVAAPSLPPAPSLVPLPPSASYAPASRIEPCPLPPSTYSHPRGDLIQSMPQRCLDVSIFSSDLSTEFQTKRPKVGCKSHRHLKLHMAQTTPAISFRPSKPAPPIARVTANNTQILLAAQIKNSDLTSFFPSCFKPKSADPASKIYPEPYHFMPLGSRAIISTLDYCGGPRTDAPSTPAAFGLF